MANYAGIKRRIQECFTSYLKSKKQAVKIYNLLSLSFDCEVPKGSMSGSLCFVIDTLSLGGKILASNQYVEK